jgi:hypothetical protein
VRQLAQLDPVTIAPDQRATAAKALAYSGALLDMLPARQHGVSVASSSEDGDQC